MFLNAYYFRAHMYTLVPRHVRQAFSLPTYVPTVRRLLG